MEIITHSPRLLALFTICYLGRANYIYEKDTLCAVQYSVLKQFPAFIAIMSTADWLIRRQLVLTLDDCIFVMLYIVVRHIDSQLPQEDHIPSFFKIKVKTNDDNQGSNGSSKDKDKKDGSKVDKQELLDQE